MSTITLYKHTRAKAKHLRVKKLIDERLSTDREQDLIRCGFYFINYLPEKDLTSSPFKAVKTLKRVKFQVTRAILGDTANMLDLKI